MSTTKLIFITLAIAILDVKADESKCTILFSIKYINNLTYKNDQIIHYTNTHVILYYYYNII